MIGDYMHPGCVMSGNVRKGKDSVSLAVKTHPLSVKTPVTLFRTLAVPKDDPVLHFEVVNVRGGDFRLEAKVDGIRILSTDIGDSDGAKSDIRLLRSFDLSLAPWAGKTVTVELVNRATGWNCEAAIWSDLRVDAAEN